MELDGKTLGIFGFGAIGHRVAQIAETFGMQVLVCTPHEKPLDGLHSTRFADADTVLANSDIITCHCPLTPDTQGMMNAAAFDKMKDGAIFINTSRGPVVDEDALAQALNSGKLAGAGLDVLSTDRRRLTILCCTQKIAALPPTLPGRPTRPAPDCLAFCKQILPPT